MYRHKIVIQGVEYLAIINEDFTHPQIVGALVSLTRLSDKKVVWELRPWNK